MSMSLGWGKIDIHLKIDPSKAEHWVLFILGLLTSSESLHWPLPTAKRSFSDRSLRAAEIYGWTHTYLKSWLFKERTAVNAPQGPMISPVDFSKIKFWPGLLYQSWNPSCATGPISNQKAAGYLCNLNDTITIVYPSCQPVCIVAYKIQCWVGSLMTFFPISLHSNFRHCWS